MKIISSLIVVTVLLTFTTIQSVSCQRHVKLSDSPDRMSPPLSNRSFVPDWNSKSFMKDGKAFRYFSGEFHYTRVLPEYWQERLQQMKAAGLDAVQTYVFWNVHEPRHGVYDFGGRQNLFRFIDLAHKEGLLVILRVGPYVDAEWDLGGLPSWLLTTENIMLRSADMRWQSYVYEWLDVLLPMVEPYLYRNGGPVILMQFENEYGSFGADWEYISNLITFFNDALPKENGLNLFSVDGANFTLLKRGSETGVFATIDFGVEQNVSEAVGELRKFMPGNPFVNSELYTGWLDYWGGQHHTIATDKLLTSVDDILKLNGSVSFYMFTGGTNFGFMNGADAEYSPVTTSYDYDAPISEGGNLTDKYFAIREFIGKYRNATLPKPPESRKKLAYGKVSLGYFGSIRDEFNLKMNAVLYILSSPVTMEWIDQSFGYIFYKTTFATGKCKQGSPSTVNITIQDRAHFFFNGELVTVLNRTSNPVVTFYKNCSITNQTIEVFVENMGRICFQHRDVFTGHSLLDTEVKGILEFNKTDESIKLWEVYSLPMASLDQIKLKPFEFNPQVDKHLCYYHGVLPAETKSQNDTYLYLEQFSKGQVFINDFNLGRYWTAMGPQKSLYVPGVLFSTDSPNTITLFEIDNCTNPTDAFVSFLDVPDLGK